MTRARAKREKALAKEKVVTMDAAATNTLPPQCKDYPECYEGHPCPDDDDTCADNVCYPPLCGGEGMVCCDCGG